MRSTKVVHDTMQHVYIIFNHEYKKKNVVSIHKAELAIDMLIRVGFAYMLAINLPIRVIVVHVLICINL